MITLKDFMECTEFKLTETTPFMWKCYGDHAVTMDYWNGENNTFGANVSIVFDTKTQFVYEMQAWDYFLNNEYRWIHPGYIEGHAAEALERGVDHTQSIDDRKFIDLEVAEDMLDKAFAIGHEMEYDDRIMIPLNLGEDELFEVMKLAHEADMSLNQYVEYILRTEMDRLQSE